MDLNSPRQFHHEQTNIVFQADMPSAQQVRALTLVESGVEPDGAFNPHTAIRNEMDSTGKEKEIISTGRFQLASHTIPELLDKGLGNDLFTPQEQKILRQGTFEEKKGLMITRADQVDKLALRRLQQDSQRLDFDNPVVDGHYWQSPKRTMDAVKAITGGQPWGDFQKKHGRKGAALLLMNEIEKDAPHAVRTRIAKYRDNIDQLTSDKGVQMASLDPYTQDVMSDVYGISPTSGVEQYVTAQTTVMHGVEARELDSAMQESDDPGVLMAGLDWMLDAITLPSDKTRAYLADQFGLDVDPQAMEKGRVTAKEFILAVSPEMESFLEGEKLPDWDPNKTTMENALHTIQAVNANVAATTAEMTTDVLTDPLAAIAAGFGTMAKAVRTTYDALRKIGQTRAGKAIDTKMAQAKAEVDKLERVEKVIDQGKTATGTSLGSGTDTVNDTKKILFDIENDTLATIKARELELGTGMNRTIAQANREAVEKISQDTWGVSIDQARKLFPNAPINDTQFAVWSKANVAVVGEMSRISKQMVRAKETGQTEKAATLQKKAMELYEAHRQLVMANESGVSASGRVMRFSQEPTDIGGSMFQMEKLDARLEKEMVKAGGDPAIFLEGLAAIDDPLKIAAVTHKLNEPGMFDLYREVLVNELLSGPATHVLNLTTGLTSLTYGGLQRTVGAAITNFKGKNPAQADLRDAANYWWGALTAVPEAVAAIAKMPFDKKKSLGKLMASDENKIAQERTSRVFTGGTPQPGDGPAMNFMRMVGGYVGTMANTPITALMAGDRGMRHVMANAELRFLASQMADAKISAMGTRVTSREAGKVRKDFIKDVVHNPQQFNPLLKQALDHADDGIFTARLKGFQGKLEEARASSKTAMIAVPFFKAIMNIGNYEARRLPGLQWFSKDFRSQLSSSDPLVKQQAYGNLAMGTSLAVTGWGMAESGTIIGGAPKDHKQAAMMKDLGIEPYSLTFDTNGDGLVDRWVSYKNWGPFGTILGTMANLNKMQGYGDEVGWPEMVGESIVGVTELILDKTIAENVHQMGDTLFKFMDSPDKLTKAMERQMVTYSLLNPKITEYMQRSMDPVIRSKSGFVEQLMARTPWLSTLLPAERNILGDDLYIGFLDPNTTDVLERSMMGLLGTVAAGKQLNPAQERAITIMQPLMDQGITVSKPEREIGSLVLNKAQTDYQRDVYYKGEGVLKTTLLQDLNAAYEDWIDYKKNLDQAEIQAKLMEGGLTAEQVHNMEPNKVLQQMVNKKVDHRRDVTMKALIAKFGDEIGDRILAEQMKAGLIKDNPRNPRATSPGGTRRIDDLIQQRAPEQFGDPLDTILDAPRRIQERLQFTIGGQ